MAVTAEWQEWTTLAQAETAGVEITNTNWGSTNAVDLVALSFPIAQGARSFYKQQGLYVTAISASETVQNPTVYRSSGAPTSGDFLYFADQGDTSSVAPTISSIGTTELSALAGTPSVISPGNLTISTALNAFDFFQTQILVDAATTTGGSGITLTLEYEVVA